MSAAAEIEALRREVEREKLELRLAVGALERTARRSVDPRRLIRERPLACTAMALTVGFLLGWREAPRAKRR